MAQIKEYLEQEEQEELLYEVKKKFYEFIEKFDDELKEDCKVDTIYIECLTRKYPHLKRSNNDLKKKIKNNKFDQIHPPKICEFLTIYDTSNIFNQDEKIIIYNYCINKITPIFKHAQAGKTAICNLEIIDSYLKIIDGFSKPNILSVCITKNVLEANAQWFERLFKDLKNRFPKTKLNEEIIVISSKKNILGENATHCKNIDIVTAKLCEPNNIKIIFMCSNMIRITDVLKLCKRLNNLTDSLRKNIQIFHDEAHNPNEGIPAYRDIIEHIILQENVCAYIPISASPEPIYDEANNLWIKQIIENNVINYTSFSKIKSNDPDYSSCANAVTISFESLKNWKDYNIDKIDIKTCEETYHKKLETINKYTKKACLKQLLIAINRYKEYNISSENELLTPGKHIELINNHKDDIDDKDDKDDIDDIDDKYDKDDKDDKLFDIYSIEEVRNLIKSYTIETWRTLDFCPFMENDKETEAVNNALNFLDLNSLYETPVFIADEFYLYIISTPRRNIITRYIAKEAIKKDYNPIVLAIYESKYHLFYDGNEIVVDSDIMKTGEFNEKLYNLIEYLKSKNININRPFIIIGNYSPTGESITYVNYKYGIVRANCRLISTNASLDYQEGSRSNYTTKKFKENNKDWKPPIKFLVGPTSFIQNCLNVEKENDERIDTLMNSMTDSRETYTHVFNNITSNNNINNLQISIPVKITIGDPTHPRVKRLYDIMIIKRKKEVEKKEFFNILMECVKDPYIDVTLEDKTGKLCDELYTIKGFRTYKKKEEPNHSSWKFKSYYSHYCINTPFINEKNNYINKYECDLLTCVDDYIEENKKDKPFVNFKKTWWLSYTY
jgi:hypothetical protein